MTATLLTIAAAAADPSTGIYIASGVAGAALAAVPAIIAAYKKGQATPRPRVTIDGQPISVEVTQQLATKGEMRELETRIVSELKKLEASLNNERSVARVANGNLHARIDKTDGVMMEMKGELHQINANLNRLVDHAIGGVTRRKLP